MGRWNLNRCHMSVLVCESILAQVASQVAVLSKRYLLGTKVNNMASRVKGLVCLWYHEHGRTYRSHDFSGGGRSRVLVSWRSTRDTTSRRRVPWLATPCYLLSFPIRYLLDSTATWEASLLWRTHCQRALGMFVQRKYERDNMVTLRWRGNVSLSVE